MIHLEIGDVFNSHKNYVFRKSCIVLAVRLGRRCFEIKMTDQRPFGWRTPIWIRKMKFWQWEFEWWDASAPVKAGYAQTRYRKVWGQQTRTIAYCKQSYSEAWQF